MTVGNTRLKSVSQFLASPSSPIPLRKLFKKPVVGWSMLRNTRPTTRYDITCGEKMIMRWKFLHLINFWVRRRASARPTTVFMTVVTTVNSTVLPIYFKYSELP